MAVCETPANGSVLSLVPLPPGARYADPRKRLVAELVGRKGFPRHRHKQAKRLVVDDFGDAVAYEVRCASCKRWGSSPAYESRYCGPCKLFVNRKRYARDPARAAAQWRERQAWRMENEPGYRERESARKRAWEQAAFERDPEGVREKRRLWAAQERARVRRDPERYRARLEAHRMSSVLRRMALGLPTGTGKGRRVNGTGTRLARGKDVSTRPLAVAVAREAARLHEDPLTGEYIIAERAGLSPKVLYNWRTGKQQRALWDTADRVLVAIDREWWEVFDATPGLFSGVRSRDVTGWVKAGLDAAELWGDP